MITAYLGEGLSRRVSPVKLAAVAIAALTLTFAPVALAQEPAATPSATDAVDTSIPGVTEAPAVEAAPAAAEAAAEGEGEAAAEEGEALLSAEKLWEESDIVGKSVLILMILMSAGSWYIVVTKLISQNSWLSQAKKIDNFWEASTVDEGIDQMGAKNGFRAIAEEAVRVQGSGVSGLQSRIDRSGRMSHAVSLQVERVSGDLSNGMAFLATVGSVSPFVGLFGTVWGILKALLEIGASGQASIDKVAGPVGEALVMTAIGLAVAVPAVIFYNMLGRRNKNVADMARHFGQDVEQLLSSSAKS